MYRYEFKEDDLFINRLKTYPEYNIFIYQGRHYINRELPSSGSFSGSNMFGRKRDGLPVFDINQNRTHLMVKPFIRTNARLDDWKYRLHNSTVKNISAGGIYATANTFNADQTVYTQDTDLFHHTGYSGSSPITRRLTIARTATTRTKCSTIRYDI